MEINRIVKALNKKTRVGDRIGFIGEDEEYSKYAVGIPLVYINNELSVYLDGIESKAFIDNVKSK